MTWRAAIAGEEVERVASEAPVGAEGGHCRGVGGEVGTHSGASCPSCRRSARANRGGDLRSRAGGRAGAKAGSRGEAHYGREGS